MVKAACSAGEHLVGLTGFSCMSDGVVVVVVVVQDIATMQFCANKLDKKDFFGKSDPFLVFYRSNEDGT